MLQDCGAKIMPSNSILMGWYAFPKITSATKPGRREETTLPLSYSPEPQWRWLD
jgi:hypothetical protein